MLRADFSDILFRTAVPNLGTSARCMKDNFPMGLWDWGGGGEVADDLRALLYWALRFYHYYISSTSDHCGLRSSSDPARKMVSIQAERRPQAVPSVSLLQQQPGPVQTPAVEWNTQSVLPRKDVIRELGMCWCHWSEGT